MDREELSAHQHDYREATAAVEALLHGSRYLPETYHLRRAMWHLHRAYADLPSEPTDPEPEPCGGRRE